MCIDGFTIQVEVAGHLEEICLEVSLGKSGRGGATMRL
jgi:hypothetical protein